MKKFTAIFGLVMAIGIVGAFAMSDLIAIGTWRYKITVSVDTPEGLKTGSAVRQVMVNASKPLIDLPEATSHKESKGEAVVVDLGERGVLFALTSFDDYQVVLSAFPSPYGLTPDGVRYYSQLKNVRAVLKPEQYPRFVKFRDIKDPKTVEAVDPNNLVASFDEGVRLKEVIIEMTDEPVTWGIEKWLPWLKEYNEKMFDGQRYNTIETNYPLANSMSAGAFSTRSMGNE